MGMMDLGQPREAKKLFEAALDHARQEMALPSPDPTFYRLNPAIIEDNLGHALMQLGDLSGARSHCANALQAALAILGPDHREMGRFYNTLGLVLQKQDDHDGARQLFQKRVEVARQDAKNAPEDLAEALHNLAWTYMYRDISKARALLEETLAIEEGIAGHEGALPTTLYSIGLTYLGENNTAGTRSAWTRALALAQQYSPHSPVIAELQSGLASLAP
jgi:tetratricopeptide (TPR) repeat protein